MQEGLSVDVDSGLYLLFTVQASHDAFDCVCMELHGRLQ